MKDRLYFIICGALFGIVSLIHLLRLIKHFEFVIGSWHMPLWGSWPAMIFAGALSVWTFRLAGKRK